MAEVTELKPCPFCGMDLSTSNFPQVMTVRPVRSEEYLIAKMEHKKIIGSDAGYAVTCIQCGSTGRRGMSKTEAIKYWNQRTDKIHTEFNDDILSWRGALSR